MSVNKLPFENKGSYSANLFEYTWQKSTARQDKINFHSFLISNLYFNDLMIGLNNAAVVFCNCFFMYSVLLPAYLDVN